MATIQIKMKGLVLEASAPFEEGHTLTKAEADALNQVRAENVRNNFAGKINEALEAAGVQLATELPADLQKQFQTEFSDYDDEYEFGIRRPRETDPVKVEAYRIASKKVLDAMLKAQPGLKASQVPAKDIRFQVEQNWPRYGDRWMDMARQSLAIRNAGDEDLEVTPVTPKPAGGNGDSPVAEAA